MIEKRYPGGKRKAFNVTYDDGVLQDVPFLALLNRYGLKGTFNLNSGLMEQSFSWKHPCGMTVSRLPVEGARALYEGHEVASHTRTHPDLSHLTKSQILHEMGRDRDALSEIFGCEISGFAVPFTYCSDLIRECAREVGFSYVRVSEESGTYSASPDRYLWKAGIFHLSPELETFVDGFLQTDKELALCQIVGHSYDLDTEGQWDTIERIFRKIHSCGDVLPMTNIALVRYLDAMEQAVVTEGQIHNPTDQTLWFCRDGRILAVPPTRK